MFNDKHKTVSESNEVRLYEIVFGTVTYRYTSAEQTIEVAGNIYESLPGIENTGFNNTGDSQRNELTITVDFTTPIFTYLIEFIPTFEITCRILSIERDDPDMQVIHEWSGIYNRYEANHPRMDLIFAPFDRDLNRDALVTSYGVTCQWTQYDDNCGLNFNAFGLDGTVTAINGLLVTTNLTLNTPTADHFLGGFVQISGAFGLERAWIIAQSGANIVEIDRRLQALVNGVAIKVVPSCRGEFARCIDPALFNNKQRFFAAVHANKVNPFTDDVRGEF